MHSKIFQIGSKPIKKVDYSCPEDYYDVCDDFADYIGDEVTGEDRKDTINSLAEMLKDVFDRVGSGVFAYKGEDSLRKFKQAWADELRRQAGSLSSDNLFQNQRLYLLRAATEETHLRSSFRVDIVGWTGGTAYSFGELFEYAASELKEGDRIYVGAVIDFHY